MPNPAIRRHRTYAQGGGLPAAEAYAAKVLAYSPWVYYKMNEASGTAVTDYGSLGVDVAHTGAGLSGQTTGPDGSTPAPVYLDSDGLVTGIFTSALDAVYTMDDISIIFWYRFDGLWSDTANETFVRLYKNTGDNLNIRKRGANVLAAELTINSVNQSINFNVVTAGLDDGNWHALCLVLNATGNVTELYVDGIIRGTGAHGGTAETGLNSVACAIAGSRESSPAAQLNGSISDFAIIPSVLETVDSVDLATYGP